MCDIVESVRRTPCTDKELARYLRRIMKEKSKWSIEAIALKTNHNPQYLRQLLKDFPDVC